MSLNFAKNPKLLFPVTFSVLMFGKVAVLFTPCEMIERFLVFS